LIEFWTNFTGFFLQLHYRSALNLLILQTLRNMIKFIATTFATLSFRYWINLWLNSFETE